MGEGPARATAAKNPRHLGPDAPNLAQQPLRALQNDKNRPKTRPNRPRPSSARSAACPCRTICALIPPGCDRPCTSNTACRHPSSLAVRTFALRPFRTHARSSVLHIHYAASAVACSCCLEPVDGSLQTRFATRPAYPPTYACALTCARKYTCECGVKATPVAAAYRLQIDLTPSVVSAPLSPKNTDSWMRRPASPTEAAGDFSRGASRAAE